MNVHEQQQGLTPKEKQQLLNLARHTLAVRLKTQADPSAGEYSPGLNRPGACFVSLHLDGQLRGCIGSLTASEPLSLNVVRNAASAAFSDPRFPPLEAGVLDRIQIEISVLTPSRDIAGSEEIVPGRHGIILERGNRRAVFLPQVALQQGWDRETTLDYLARKAGLHSAAWREPETRLKVFTAIVFSESAEPSPPAGETG